MALSTTRLQPEMDFGTLVNALNQNFSLLENLNVIQIFKDNDGVPRVLLGRRSDEIYGLFVSKVGIDVTKATDDQLVFNSNQNTLKIITTDTLVLTRNAGSSSASSVVPAPTTGTAFFAWGTLASVSPNLTYPLSYFSPSATGTMLWGVRAFYDASAGAVKFIAESYDAGTTATAQTFNIKYYLLQETLI